MVRFLVKLILAIGGLNQVLGIDRLVFIESREHGGLYSFMAAIVLDQCVIISTSFAKKIQRF